MNRPEFFVTTEGKKKAFTDVLADISANVKRVADSLDGGNNSKTKTAVYLLNSYTAQVYGPSWGCFFQWFHLSDEGALFKTSENETEKISYALTWLLNRRSARLLGVTANSHSTTWTVVVDELQQE